MGITKNQSLGGYFELTITAENRLLLSSNNERAFIISQLQDLLSARSTLEEPFAHRRIAAHIDLLAFSILRDSMQFVIFSVSETSACTLAHLLTKRLAQYQSEWPSGRNNRRVATALTKLSGPHHALKQSIQLHLRHPDWEFDRYSSIGFYLHDRRGAWMRLWRVSRLYDAKSENYLQLLEANNLNYVLIEPSDSSSYSPYATLKHA